MHLTKLKLNLVCGHRSKPCLNRDRRAGRASTAAEPEAGAAARVHQYGTYSGSSAMAFSDPAEFRTYAQWGSVTVSLLLLFGWLVPFVSYDLLTDPAGWLGFGIGLLLAALEMPFICSCGPCKRVSTAMHVCEDHRLRGAGYIALSALGCFVNVQMGWSDRVRASPRMRLQQHTAALIRANEALRCRVLGRRLS
eukprot:SAG31_NODE_40_length_31360_cov_6.751575_12_plen_194_part_00